MHATSQAVSLMGAWQSGHDASTSHRPSVRAATLASTMQSTQTNFLQWSQLNVPGHALAKQTAQHDMVRSEAFNSSAEMILVEI